MSNASEYDIGAPVSCSDGACGEIVCVVINPIARALTHLVVEPKHRVGQGRLVPIDLVDASAGELCLRCSLSEFDQLEFAEETHFVSERGEDLGYGSGELLSWPYYGLAGGMDGMGGMGMAGATPTYFTSRVPADDVEVRRGEVVHASDGDIGRVQGLIVDPGDHHVTHVLLQEGHLWGKKEVAIPIGCVKDVAVEGVQLELTKDQVKNLPAVALAGSH